MDEDSEPRNNTAFPLVLLLLCVLPFGGLLWWKSQSEPPAVCEPLIYELWPGTTLELRAVSFGTAKSPQFWSPNGVLISPENLVQETGGSAAKIRAVYFRCVSKDGPKIDLAQLRIQPSPTTNAMVTRRALEGRDPKTKKLQANYSSCFIPQIGMFESTEMEVAYSTRGFTDVGVLEPGETKKEFSVAGRAVVVSLSDSESDPQAQQRVEVCWKEGDIEFEIRLINSKGEAVGPVTTGREYKFDKDNRDQKIWFAEFSEKEFAQFKIRALHREKTIKFSGISYAPGSYTQPKVTATPP